MAGPISCKGTIRSALPVRMAASGMPANSAVVGSFDNDCSANFLNRPHAHVAIAAGAGHHHTQRPRAHAAATDSNSKSADGRTKCTSSVRAKVNVISRLTSKCWSGGAI